jgi:hypothetical protein
MYAPLRRRGIEKLYELCMESEFENDVNEITRIGNVISNFPVEMVEIASAYDENANDGSTGLTEVMSTWGVWQDINYMTTKELQSILKQSLSKIERLDFNHRLGFNLYNSEQKDTFRRHRKNVKLRHIYFRLVTRDFLTKERMFKFGMSGYDDCERCGVKESYRHLFWECHESRKVWRSFNKYMSRTSNSHIKVEKYEDVFDIYQSRVVSIIKVRIIQAMIQIERPKNWIWEIVRKIAMDLKSVETHNSVAHHKLDITKRKWELIK